MLSKTHIILVLFLFLVMTYFVYMLSYVIKKSGKTAEHFDDTKEPQKEKFEEKQLDMNLFIINTFENVHDRKIKMDELKHFTELFSTGSVGNKNDMKNVIENFKKEKFTVNDKAAEEISELEEISNKLQSVIKKLKEGNVPEKKTAKPETKVVEKFTDILPFSNEKKYMPIL
jgi:hypothetical protein